MDQLQLILALGRTLSCDTAARRVVWDKISHEFPARIFGEGGSPPPSPQQIHEQIYRLVVRRQLPPDAVPRLEECLRCSAQDWITYVASLPRPKFTVQTRLQHLLLLPDPAPGEADPETLNALWDLVRTFHEDLCVSAEPTPPQTERASTLVGALDFQTKSQRAATDRLRAMALLYFETISGGDFLIPRLFPLVVGETGTGKSSLVARVAKDLNAVLIRTTVSQWIPQGAREAPTLQRIVTALKDADRAVLFVDELDKLHSDSSTWARSVLGEIFDVLEKQLPQHLVPKSDAEDLPHKLRNRLWIVGGGAWQHLHGKAGQARFPGFAAPALMGASAYPGTWSERLLADGFSPELLGRFHRSPIHLRYPDAAETEHLLERLGFVRLAEKIHRLDLIRNFSWAPFGIRNLESLYCDLLIAERVQAVSPTTATLAEETAA